MLLVAITGPVGSAKTSLLHDFVIGVMERGHSVDGFVSLAGVRKDLTKGAESYTLRWIKTGERQLFAQRNEAGQFQINPETMDHIDQWSKELPAKQDLVALDEFGKWEAAGEGLMPYWKAIEASKPRMIVVTLREGCRQQIEARLGRKFNRVFDAEATDTPAQLRAMFAELKDWELVGTYGASSGGLECSLGSWLHATRFPFVGTIMGSLQAAVLAVASKGLGRKELIVWISTISAGLKALSPAGSRIPPMIAIAVQGFLFAVGAMAGRWTKAGFAFGAFLVGIWAALQGFFIQYLLLGRSLDRAWGVGANYLRQKIGIAPPNMWIVVLILCIVNGAISLGLTLAIISRGRIMPSQPNLSTSSRRWLFWMPLVLVTVTLMVSGERISSIMWILFRVVAVMISLYGVGKLVAHIDFGRILTRRGLWGPALAVQVAKDESTSK